MYKRTNTIYTYISGSLENVQKTQKPKVLLKALQKIESVDNGPVWSLEYSENKGENSYE